jgi:hypothetical protein
MIEDGIQTKYFTNIREVISTVKLAGKNRRSINVDDVIDESLPVRYYMDKYIINAYSKSLAMSPNSFYIRNKEVLQGTAKEIYTKIMEDVINERQYTISAVIWIINTYGIKSILDPMAKFGDRIFSCAACNIKYLGFDEYLPAHEGYKNLIDLLRLNKTIKILDSNYIKTVIKEDYQLVYMSFDDESDTYMCDVIIKAWSDISEDGFICVSFSRKSDRQNIVSRLMKTQLGIYPAFNGKKLETKKLSIYLWRKSSTIQSYPSEISIVDNAILTTEEALILSGLSIYKRSFANNISYISVGEDLTAEYIAKAVKGTNTSLTIYADSRLTRYLSSIEFLSANVKLIKYLKETDYDEKKLIGNIEKYLDDPVFNSCLTFALKITLPRDAKKNIIEPGRVWLKISNLSLLRSLLFLWDKTTFLLPKTKDVDRIMKNINVEYKPRLIIIDEDQLSLLQLKNKYGYKTDYIISQKTW